MTAAAKIGGCCRKWAAGVFRWRVGSFASAPCRLVVNYGYHVTNWEVLLIDLERFLQKMGDEGYMAGINLITVTQLSSGNIAIGLFGEDYLACAVPGEAFAPVAEHLRMLAESEDWLCAPVALSALSYALRRPRRRP